MDVTIWYTNWPPHIISLPATESLHEDTDAETRLHYLQVYDYNYDNPSDNPREEDNATCWIHCVYDQWGENDTKLFSLRQENPSYLNKWDSYTLWKNECVVPGSPYSPPCGYKRDNYTCPKHSGCMTHNVTQWYNVSIICEDGYGARDNRNFTFYPIRNEAPKWRNLGNHRDIDLKTGSEHDIIFSIMYTDKENENLTYEYTFMRVDTNEPTTLFKGDPSGNYFNTLGNISLTTYLFDVDKNTSYSIFICGHERRNEICEYLTIDIEEYCEIVPTCSSAENTVDETLAIGTTIFNVASLISVSNARIKFTVNANRNDLFEIDEFGKVRTLATLPAPTPQRRTILTHSFNWMVQRIVVRIPSVRSNCMSTISTTLFKSLIYPPL
ncbi:uncharacterized protein LOC127836502 [Dreissena polymorpha]|uniref:Uncharacterized protein n=1 Tax=Dreissena polymorpha TaxID=45954 RepID=A0A9D4G0U1_DREPO|nr:uncharacterized protein LOC127836502 [Dreissena polymorpha]KAH3808570.1 hypothetical protein DPMN_136927 [Dreissena polymorpha]